MRTSEQIAERLRNCNGLFSFEPEILMLYIEFDVAKEFIQEKFRGEEHREKWQKCQIKPRAILNDMANYMSEFGWPKALSHRGISASRTIDKMSAWLWLLEDEETLEAVNAAPYESYGCPKLALICQKYGWPIPDDTAIQNMIKGQHCGADYACGCGE